MIDLFVNAAISADEVLHFPKELKKLFFPFFSKYGEKVFSSTGQTISQKNTCLFTV